MSYIKKLFRQYNDNLYFLMISYILIYPLISGVFELLNYRLLGNSLFKTSILLTLGVYLLKVLKKYILSVILLIEIIFIGLVLLNWLDWIQFFNRELYIISKFLFEYLKIETIVDAIHSYKNYIFGINDFVLYPVYFEIILQLSIIGLVFYLVFYYKPPYELLIIGLVFIYAWFQYREISMAFILFYFLGVVLYTYEYYHHKALTKGKNNTVETSYYRFKKLRLSYIIIAVIIFGSTQLIITFFPVTQINQSLSKYVPSVERLRTAYYKQKSFGYYSLENSMYHPLDNILGGSIIKTSDETLMYIKTASNNKYFRGRVKNRYTGENWINENTVYEKDISIDTKGKLLEAEIQATNLKTITLFSPYKFVNSSLKSSYVYSNEDSIQLYNGPQTPALEKSYTVYWTNDYKIDLSESKKRHYLDYPGNGLSNTKNIVNEIIDDAMTDYEKMKAIETYLRDNNHYKYSLRVSEQKQTDDFVENFITYEKRGYCTYFASATAIMGRMADVPTRYVEGFILPNETNKDGYYEITESRAHAWVEAYIENEGWIVIESTPAYQVLNENIGETQEIDDVLISEENMNLGNNIANNIEKDLRIGEDFEVLNEKEPNYDFYIYFLTLLMFLLLVIWLIIKNYIKRKEYNLSKLSDHNKAQKYFEGIIQLLALAGYNKKNNEFQLEFIENTFKNELAIQLGILEQLSLEKLLYTSKKLNNQEYLTLKEIYLNLFEYLHGNKTSLMQLYFQLRIR